MISYAHTMEGTMNDYSKIYDRGPKDESFHIKNFMLNYKSLIDISALKEDSKRYISRIRKVNVMLGKVDFTKNLLFVSKENINRDVFFCGFSRLPELHTYYYCSIIDLHEILWGLRRKDNVNISEDEVMYSEQNIKQDVLCIYADSDSWVTSGISGEVKSTVSSRSNNVNVHGKPLRTWIFFRGTYKELTGDKFVGIYDFYKNNPDDYSIVFLDSLGKNNIPPINADGKTSYEKKSSGNLSDVY